MKINHSQASEDGFFFKLLTAVGVVALAVVIILIITNGSGTVPQGTDTATVAPDTAVPVVPGTDTTGPVNPDTVPTDTTGPEDTTSIPADTTAPEDTTAAPVDDTTEVPDTTTQEPSKEPLSDVPTEDEMLAHFPGVVLPYSADAVDESYLDDIIFLGDSTTYGLKAYAMLKDGKETKQVWTPTNGTLTLSRANNAKIYYPDTQEEITIAEAASIKRPKIMVITLGVNGISFMNEEQFKDAYTTLIRSIQQSSPDTKIILQSIFPVCKKYDTSGGIDNTKIYRADIWVAEIAQTCGCRYLYTACTLTGSDNYLLDSYENGDGLHLNQNGYSAELTYIQTHPYLD